MTPKTRLEEKVKLQSTLLPQYSRNAVLYVGINSINRNQIIAEGNMLQFLLSKYTNQLCAFKRIQSIKKYCLRDHFIIRLCQSILHLILITKSPELSSRMYTYSIHTFFEEALGNFSRKQRKVCDKLQENMVCHSMSN